MRSKRQHRGSDGFVACGARDPPAFSALSTASWPNAPDDRALSWREMSPLHRMTWWCGESTGLKHLRGTMSARAHDVVTWAYLRGKPVTCPRRVRSCARRPQTVVFSLASFYHRGAQEVSCTTMLGMAERTTAHVTEATHACPTRI